MKGTCLRIPHDRAGRVHLKLFVIVAVIAVSVCGYLSLFEEPVKPVVYSTPPNRNTQPEVAYVGDQVCGRCHQQIAEKFAHHPMGRSMTTPENVLPEASGKVIDLGDFTYWIEHRNGRSFHLERRKAQDDKPIKTEEHQVHYVIGSGTRRYAFLIEKENDLHLSPISWDNQTKTWDLVPGYRRKNQHFDQKVTDKCLFCHANRFEKIKGRPITFDGLSIGCERCHGPGSLHAKHPEPIDGEGPSIVNPATLKPVALRENVCEQCHIQSYRRSEAYVGSSHDYRPGLPLEKFLYITPERFGITREPRILGHVQQMQLSRCYSGSRKELGCISCHDPHSLPESSERIAYYQKRCLKCHADRGCLLPADVRLKKSPEDDCISCHMPKLPPSNVAHSAITDHTIPRLPE
jgi:hypothetical protein